jgi:hypothetical protein
MNYGNGRKADVWLWVTPVKRRGLCPTSLLCDVGSTYYEAPGVEIL